MKNLNAIVMLGLMSGSSLASADAILTKLIIVDRADDSADGDCSRGAARGKCNLRAAVAEALKQGDATVQLTLPSLITQGPISVAPASLAKKDLKIEGIGSQQVAITGNTFSRFLELNQFAKVSLKNVVISQFAAWESGAILNSGSLTLQDVTVKDNKASCPGVGAMTAFANCGGGALTNSGTVTLKNVVFAGNRVYAQATTASYTTANGYGGAIQNGGTIVFDGRVAFENNTANVLASSGWHPMPTVGATASSSGGAISSFNGTLVVKPNAVGKCRFSGNVAKAEAAVPADKQGTATHNSRGGAVIATGGVFDLAAAACSFDGNVADSDADFVAVP